jgi:hypothetical protein
MRSRWSAPHSPVAVLREVAEYPNAFVDLSPGQERIDTGRYTLCLEPSRFAATVQRQRFAPEELDEVIEEVRGLLRDRGRDRTQAGAMSAPVLTRLGFIAVGHVDMLVDDFAAAGASAN